jgi:hypothetical protein
MARSDILGWCPEVVMTDVDALLTRWIRAGLLEQEAAERIRQFEAGAPTGQHLRWPAILAIAFGALMVGGGLLLFVAAHWDRLSPDVRFLSVLSQVVLFHLAGVWFTDRMPKLATAMHGLGTLALGAGIFLAGQIFNLQEHWPGGIMLWALGAWFGYAILKDWVQGSLVAMLTPAWLIGEWQVATQRGWSMADGAERILAIACFLLATTYLTGRHGSADGLLRKSLSWIGGLVLIPCVLGIVITTHDHSWWHQVELGRGLAALGWVVGIGAPLGLALWMRGRAAWMNAAAGTWALLLGFMGSWQWQIYAWCALGAVGLVFWGLHEARRERVNLGVAGFAITLISFYFSNVLDKLGRSFGLMGLGLLFLLGGWQLERLRRMLNARIAQGGGR